MGRECLLYTRTDVLIRENAGSQSPVIFRIPRGEAVQLEPDSGIEVSGHLWVSIRYRQNRAGWCQRHLLTENPPRG